jgi:hypothetical protein
MKINIFSPKSIGIIFSLLLTSCDDSGISVLAGGGIGGTGDVATITISSSASTSVGPITNFGSVFVNGIEYDTKEAVIFVDGQPTTEDALALGMIVQIEGRINADSKTGVAQQIRFDEDVVGPIQSIAEDGGSLVVLGQTIQIDELTIFTGVTDIDALEIGQIVAVSGLTDAEGNISASRIALQPATAPFRIRGRPQQIDPINQTLTIGELTVNYQQAPVFESGIAGQKMGMEWVNVQGTLVGNQLVADHLVTEEPQLISEVGTQVTLQGIITRFNHAEDFEITHSRVATTLETQFTLGTAADLALGVQVRVNGQFNADDVLVLNEVFFLKPPRNPRINIDADVQAIDVANHQLTLLGIPVQTTAFTLFQDKQQAKNAFGLEDLYVGSRVKIHGFLDVATGIPVADRLQRPPTNAPNGVMLEGPIKTVDTSSRTLNILGVTIMVEENTLYFDEFPVKPRAEGNKPLLPPESTLTEIQFFSKVETMNPAITVRGRLVGDIIVAEMLMIQPK